MPFGVSAVHIKWWIQVSALLLIPASSVYLWAARVCTSSWIPAQNKPQCIQEGWDNIKHLFWPQWYKLEINRTIFEKIHKYMKIKQHAPEQPKGQWRALQGNLKISWNKWKWNYNITKVMGYTSADLNRKSIAIKTYIKKSENPLRTS